MILKVNINNKTILENSCGDGNILVEIVNVNANINLPRNTNIKLPNE